MQKQERQSRIEVITEAAEEKLSNKLDSLACDGEVVELSNGARFVRAESGRQEEGLASLFKGSVGILEGLQP
jgi:hypothetical protein